MKGIVFVLHGRKNRLSTTNMSLIEKLAPRLIGPYEIGLLEGEQQTLEAAIHALLSKQVEEIVFLPILLFPATHAKEDLPQRAAALLKDKLPYRILETLGTTQAVSTFLIQQVKQANLATREILLIAHGTPHYEVPYQQLCEVAEKVSVATNQKVYPAHYHGEHLYQDILAQHPEPLLIQRLFLTEGYLAKKITDEIQTLRGTIDELLPTLQDQPALEEAILERLGAASCIQS
ncbi:sirohydrochlorin chelatase [Enterococcus sp. AZ109]|uniref:sirohydrochlorin chelatase n=1 Tax=Enterococcus sp. AZ109 TaxID=2774634 RepID=UPI003F28D178